MTETPGNDLKGLWTFNFLKFCGEEFTCAIFFWRPQGPLYGSGAMEFQSTIFKIIHLETKLLMLHCILNIALIHL